jgi:hypothetical protein
MTAPVANLAKAGDRLALGFGLAFADLYDGPGLGALDHSNYCIWCHNQGKGSCSHGLRDRRTGAYENDAFGVKLLGARLRSASRR